MFSPNVPLTLLLIASTVVDAASLDRRTGKSSLSFSTKINKQGILDVVTADRARALALLPGNPFHASASSIDVNNTIIFYVAQVGIGNPPTNYALLVDSGSANTWIGAGKPYMQTNSSQDTGYYASVAYGSGQFDGTEWNDTVTLNPSLVVKQQSIAVASSSSGMPKGIDGILGIGPLNLTANTVQGMDTVPTVMDNLLSQGTIDEEVLGVYFIPYADPGGSCGELTFGGYDQSVTMSPVTYVPLTGEYPASLYWGIEQSVNYGGEAILSSTAGIVDTGSTLLLLATDAFQKYLNLTGATKDKTTGLLTITPDKYAKLQPLCFNIGNDTLVLTPNGQTWPRSLNTAIGGNATAIYLIVADIGYSSGSGLDFINGYTFLERFYTVYDATNKRVGFGHTEYTFSESN